MSFLNDKLKTKKAGHSDGFRNLIDSTENERNISLSKSSRHFLRDLEIRGAMGQVPEHGIDEIIISPDNKIEPFGTTTPVNANEDDNLKIEGYHQLKWAYMDGRQHFILSNIRQTIDFHMHIRFESFSQVGEKFLFQKQAGNGYMVAVAGYEGKGGFMGGASFNFPYYSHISTDTQGVFSVGPIKEGNIWSNAGGGCTLENLSIEEENGVYTISGMVDGSRRTVTFTENTDQIWFFANGAGQSGFIGRVGFILLYNGNNKAAELVPAERLSDGVVGFLDTVSEEFYESRTVTPFYDHYDSTNYGADIDRNLPREDRIVYKLTLKSAKRGLPKGYREITELVSPGVPWTGDQTISHVYERYLKLPFVLNTDYIYDIDAYPTPRHYDGNYNAPMVYGGIFLSGVQRSGLDVPDTTIATFVDAGGRHYRAEQDSEFLRYRNLAKAYIGRAPEEAYTPSGLNLAKRFVLSFDENNDKHAFLSVYCDAVKNNIEYKGKFSISLFADHSPETRDIYFGIKRPDAIQCVTGFCLKKISVSDRSGKLLFDVRACKKEATGEFGVYYVNYEEGKEGFIPFTLVNEVDIEAIKEAGARYWERLIGLTAFPEESQTYLSGESTLLRDIKETTIYLPEPLLGIPSYFYDNLAIANKTGEKFASLTKTIGTRIVSGGPIEEVPDTMKDYGLEYPEVIADNPDWDETLIDNASVFVQDGNTFKINLSENQETGHYELPGYGDSVTLVVPKDIRDSNGNQLNLANGGLCHFPWQTSWNQLKRVYIPTGYETLPAELFYYDQRLEEVILPSNLKTINKQAFMYCYSLKKIYPANFYGKKPTEDIIILPNSVKTIGYYAFHQCKAKVVALGSGVTEIGRAAFSTPTREGRSMIERIYLPDNVKNIYSHQREGIIGDYDLGNLNFYCNKDTITYWNLKAHLKNVYSLTEEQAEARIITEDKGGGYINFNYPDTFNVYYAAFNYFHISNMVLPIVCDRFQEVPGTRYNNKNNRGYFSPNFMAPFQVTCQSWAHTKTSASIAARIWFTLPKEYDTIEKARMYFAQNPTTFYVITKGNTKIPVDLSKVEIGDGEREFSIENEFGALSDDGTSGYGTMLSNFVLGDRKNPSYTKVQYYSNKSK